jgi:alcohol dehydrogenase class IV
MIAFRLQPDLRAGAGVASAAVEYARGHACRRVGVVIDAGLRENARARTLLDELRDAVKLVQVLESDAVEPNYDYLDEFRTRLEPELDLLLGIGGGSTLDLAKAVSVLATNPRPALEYRGFDLVEHPGVPLVAIPTTAGTGSEVTPNAVFTDSHERRKLGINSALYLPKLALLDPLLLVSCPRSVTVSAGVDALVHSVESYVAAAATPLSRTYSREAFRLIATHLVETVTRPEDVDARLQMQLAAFYAGAALMNSGAGPAGALSYPLGVLYSVPHGMAGGFFLAPVAEWNLARGSEAYEGLSRGADAEAVVYTIREIVDALDIPSTLSHFGVARDDVPLLVEQTFLLAAALEQNPVPLSREDLHAFLTGLC